MSVNGDPLKVVLCWHMHQPDYRGPETSSYQLPWVYLHGIKDYVDMASHLEKVAEARAVVNFAPILLEQLADYAAQVQAWLDNGDLIRDRLLAALAGPGVPLIPSSRRGLIRACLRANEKNMVNRFPAYRRLVDIADHMLQHKRDSIYLSDQYLADLLVWYHLAWMGESVRQRDIRIQSLEKKAHGFTPADRRCLMEVIGEQLGGLIGRYRNLAEAGRVELSVTPYAHPILPLLLDIESAREATPDASLPDLDGYPGGEERVRWHIRAGVKTFESHFGFRPRGCWPSEGAINSASLRLLEEEGFHWAASGQQVLHNSLCADSDVGELPRHWLYLRYARKGGTLNCFFRDDGLSDLIGFTYADWHADDAIGNLIEHLERIADETVAGVDQVVSIIMDGENAWEYYPRNACYFLPALYKRLAEHPRLRLTTFSEHLSAQAEPASELSRLVTGSWVYGTLSTWIGDPDKNRAWEMLGEAKSVFDRVIASVTDEEHRAALERQLGVCEGSDWFWWFGDHNPAETVSDFESLFRRQLSHLYQMLGEPIPEYLGEVFAQGHGNPALGGVMKQNQ